jgi:hypothetical protein
MGVEGLELLLQNFISSGDTSGATILTQKATGDAGDENPTILDFGNSLIFQSQPTCSTS